MTDIQSTLEERGSRYGTFEDNAALAQELKAAIHARLDDTFAAVHVEALDMICHKMSRIVNGDPDYIDSWHDIAGYATLVVDHLKGKQ